MEHQKNESEGNKTAAQQRDAAATEYARTQPVHELGRKAQTDLDALLEQLKHFDVGMMVTRRPDGRHAARPMYVAGVDPDGLLRFIATRDASIVDEVAHDGDVVVTLQRGLRYLSLTGRASVSHDPQALSQCWKESFRLWFPDGPSSSDAVVLTVSPLEADYWDQSGIEGVRMLFQAAKAWIQQEPLQTKNIGKRGHVELATAKKSDAQAEA